jgi:dynamin 1-like protein
MQNNILFVILQDVHDWKEPGVDRLPLPEKAAKARAILARTNASTINAYEHIAAKPLALHQEKPGLSGNTATGGSWGITSIFSSSEVRTSNSINRELAVNREYAEDVQGSVEHVFATIQLHEVSISIDLC